MKLAIDSANLRRACLDDADLFRTINPPLKAGWYSKRIGASRYYYFVACNLRKKDKAVACQYLEKSFRQNPFHVKVIVRLLGTYLERIIQKGQAVVRGLFAVEHR